MATEKDVGPDCLRGVGFIERCRASTEALGSPSVAVRRARREMMHDGAVNVMTEGAGGGTLPMTRGTACGGVVMAPAGKTPKTKGRRRQVE